MRGFNSQMRANGEALRQVLDSADGVCQATPFLQKQRGDGLNQAAAELLALLCATRHDAKVAAVAAGACAVCCWRLQGRAAAQSRAVQEAA